MYHTSDSLAPAREPAPVRWIRGLKSLLSRRKGLGKAVLTVIVLNEIRGIIVVITVLACWKARHG